VVGEAWADWRGSKRVVLEAAAMILDRTDLLVDDDN
jgi:hypothetical protein